MFEPQRAVFCAAIAWRAKGNAEPLHGPLKFLGAEEGPHLGLGHVDQADRGLVLVSARASSRVFRHCENAAGDDQIIGAAGTEAAEVACAAVVAVVEVARRSR